VVRVVGKVLPTWWWDTGEFKGCPKVNWWMQVVTSPPKPPPKFQGVRGFRHGQLGKKGD